MVRSSGFGSINNDKRPIQTRFRYGSSIHYLNQPLTISRRLILQQERSQTLSRPPTACKLMVSCSISLPSRGSFHLSLTVLFTIGHSGIFSLTRWSSQIHTEISRAPMLLGIQYSSLIFRITRLSLSMVHIPIYSSSYPI